MDYDRQIVRTKISPRAESSRAVSLLSWERVTDRTHMYVGNLWDYSMPFQLFINIVDKREKKGGCPLTGVPNTDLGVDIEDGGRRARHSLPSPAEEVVGRRLALQVVRPWLWIGRQWIYHPRADALILCILHTALHCNPTVIHKSQSILTMTSELWIQKNL